MSGVSAMPRCPPNGVENVDPVDCPYGISSDYCGRKVCAKGPGQICGVGLFKLLGSCGEGLYCNCGRCTGCSMLTMECFDKTCV
ncbi:Neuroparsin-A [Orchesella cincta]|uniref:Neuroparsin-A n=1 Tax=Orchesella cincta TaxID=48709 RepID=A0A1D2MVF3_ORCCI|nr:Neuroparsin-A [Orchesella cincta]